MGNRDQMEDSMRYLSKTAIMMFALTMGGTTVGCASSPPLRTEKTTSGIRAAEEIGATKVPQASLHLQLAKEELERARSLAKNNEKDRAISMLSRSEADAELAIALSRADTEKAEAQGAMDRVRQLRLENK
jgi:hypothetical protein